MVCANSPRPNTPAALYEKQVPDDIKADRLQRINRYVRLSTSPAIQHISLMGPHHGTVGVIV
jgi:tRNA A37 methylthiotransferase MiaB